MTEQLYLNQCYLKEFKATVTKVEGRLVVLDKTAFYAEGGGQPADTGDLMTPEGRVFKVLYVKKMGDELYHEVDKEGMKIGDPVHGTVNWDRRYKLMRSHTAAHLLSAVVNKETGALISGNQLNIDKSRIDFSLENYNPEMLKRFQDVTNELISQKLAVNIRWMSREQMEQDPNLVKLMKGIPDVIQQVRIIAIGDYEASPCGGTHLMNLSEVGNVEITGTENKGKNNRRIYFVIKP